MRGSIKVFTVASVALLSCRAVLGIEEIEEGTTDAGTGAPDAAADSVGTDSANPADGPPVSACTAMGDQCGRCCRMNAGPAYKEELEVIIKPCLCTGGCADSCKSNLCDGGDPKDTPCLPCMDQAIRTGTCPKERDDCTAKSAACKAAYDCLASCN
jgi:hypothetical protein